MTEPAAGETTPLLPPAPGDAPTTASIRDPQVTSPYHPSSAPEQGAELAALHIPGYEILGILGRGGMGVVYRARHLALKRTIALKMVLAGGQAGPEELARFRAEAEAVARLQHPNIVQIHQVGEWCAGALSPTVPFITLEFVEGGSLAQKLGGHALPGREAARLVATLASAMHLAHSRNVVHRDLKPANVLLTADGVPKVTDFGLARQLDLDSGQTQAGAVVGTPSYMAPEQAGGQAHQAGPAADVYALGAILYECLTGRPPFRGSSVVETLDQVRHREPVAPRLLQARVPRDLETICLKCLRKEPEKRYASAAALAEDLKCFLEGRPIAARPVGWVERAAKWVRRNPAVAALTAGVGFSVVVGAVAAALLALQALASERRALQEAANAEEKAEDESRARATAEHQVAVSKVLLAQAAWRDSNVGNARALLGEVRPESRGWEWGHLQRHFQGGHLTLYGHAELVESVAFSPDGSRLASAGRDGTARVWDVHTGQELYTIRGHVSYVVGVAFSPDGTRLATASCDGTAGVWDARTGRELLTLTGHVGPVFGVAFSPDGQRLVTAGADRTARVWDAYGGVELLTLNGHTGAVFRVAYSPDGRHVATASVDGTARVWDTASGRTIATCRGHAAQVYGVAFSPDGARLATGSADKTAKLWDARSGRELLTLKGHTGCVWAAGFSPDGTRLATAASDSTAKVWDAHSGQESFTLNGHTAQVMTVAFSPDGQRLATGSGDRTVKIWDARGRSEVLTLRGHTSQVSSVAFSGDGRRVARASADGTVRVRDSRTGADVLTIGLHAGALSGVAFSGDGCRLATAGSDGTAWVWDAHTGQQILTLDGHSNSVTGVAFSPDDMRLATASYDGTAKVWDVRSGREILTLKGHTRPVSSVAWSPDGTRLATGSQDYTARVWDARTGDGQVTVRARGNGVSSVAWSPDGTRLATAADTTAQTWDARTGVELLTFKGHAGLVIAVAFSPDGGRLATASVDETAKVWDVGTGQELVTLKGHTGLLKGLAFSPDGRRLATGGTDGTARVWEAPAFAEVVALKGHTGPVLAVAFNREGTRLATASRDGTAKVWDRVTHHQLLVLKGHSREVGDVAFSADGRRLATAGWDGTGKLWDAATGQELMTLKGHKGLLLCVAFSTDGSRLVTGGLDNTARVWDAGTGLELLTLKGHTRGIVCAAFSIDGRLLMTGDGGGNARVWDAHTGQPGLGAREAAIALPVPALSPEGRWLARIDDDTVYLHDLRQPVDADELAFRTAMAGLDPYWQEKQARRWEGQGEWFAAAFHLDRALTCWADDAGLLTRRARARAELGRWVDAGADFARVAEQLPDRPDCWRGLAPTELALERTDSYRKTCARLEQCCEQLRAAAAVGALFSASGPDWMSKGALAWPGGTGTRPLLPFGQEAARTAALQRDTPAEVARLLLLAGDDPQVRGAVLCRARRYEEAVLILHGSNDAIATLYRALAEHGRGQDDNARQALDEAVRWLAAPSKDDPKKTNAGLLPWDRRVEADLLRKEAESLLPGKAAGGKD